jgi:hypothetical protein
MRWAQTHVCDHFLLIRFLLPCFVSDGFTHLRRCPSRDRNMAVPRDSTRMLPLTLLGVCSPSSEQPAIHQQPKTHIPYSNAPDPNALPLTTRVTSRSIRAFLSSWSRQHWLTGSLRKWKSAIYPYYRGFLSGRLRIVIAMVPKLTLAAALTFPG